MKRKNILKILLFVVAILIMPKKAFASSCDLAQQTDNPQLAEGTYTCTISEDVSIDQPYIITGGTITISLDHNITSTNGSVFQIEGNANVIFTGNGKASASDSDSVISFKSSGNLTISSGTYEGAYPVTITSDDNSANERNILIEGGTFTGTNTAIRVISPTKYLSINGGTFTGEIGPALTVYAPIDQLIINDGTFTGYYGASIASVNYLRINGGTFTGEKYGVLLSNIENQDVNNNSSLDTTGVLLGGTFKSTGDNSNSIGILSVEGDNDIFNKLVGNEHHYSNKFNVIRKDVEGFGSSSGPSQANDESQKKYTYAADIKNVSIVEGAPTADQKITPFKEDVNVANPKTGSMLYIYVIAFMLVSGLAIFGIYKYHKKLNN